MADEELMRLRKEREALERRVRNLAAQERERSRKLATEATGVDEDNIVLGDWDCPDSPTGYCIYDSDNDPVMDECLFCGGPDERK